MKQNNVWDYRQKNIEGRIIDLSPVTENNLTDIVRMRNAPPQNEVLSQSAHGDNLGQPKIVVRKIQGTHG